MEMGIRCPNCGTYTSVRRQQRFAGPEFVAIADLLQCKADHDGNCDRNQEHDGIFSVHETDSQRDQHCHSEILGYSAGQGDALSPVDANRHH
ncbi:hypothetical protein C9J85_03870 [Haloferax sp. wsp5]|nr:hypothetical protein C9J85_03870 [Haloferax sp. wsp5]